MKKGILLIILVVFTIFSNGCSLKAIALNSVGDALSGNGTVFTSDNDPDLVKDALPFALKLYESVLDGVPEHKGLILSTAKAFTMYAYAFLQMEADTVDKQDYEKAKYLRARAFKLYIRGRDYALKGLELNHPGFNELLKKDLKEYGVLEQESQKLNTTRDLIGKEKTKLEEDKKNYATYLEDLKHARDKKKEILEKVKSTNQGYRALVQRLEKGREKISYFAGGGNKISKASSAQYGNIFKGLLTPLKGKIVGAFGKLWDAKIKNWIYNKGVTVQADYGREVHSVSDGHVSFSGWILGYGRVLIVKHKNNIFSVYAHLARGLFNTGDTVSKGSVIGLVGDTGSVEQSSLYFELRQDRNNIDPTPLFY